MVATPSSVQAQQYFPYSCQWVSEVTPNAVIRFSSTNGVGTYKGALLYKANRLLAIHEGQSQGYATNWWRTGGKDALTGTTVVFSRNQAGTQTGTRTPGVRKNKHPYDAQRVLLIGLVSALYYGQDQRWRDDQMLLTAGEGYWRTSSGCRSLL